MKRLVADTGPLLHLHEAGALHLLPLIGQVVVPPLVLDELGRNAGALLPKKLPSWLTVRGLSAANRARSSAWQQAGLLHGGEADALALCAETAPDWFLTDDAAARLMASSIGIETHGSLGVVLGAAATRLIEVRAADLHLAALEQSTLWISPRVRAEARTALVAIGKRHTPGKPA